MTYRSGTLAAATLIAGLTFDSLQPAAASDWYRYENNYFIAFSNARERHVKTILEELETFRAAFMQVGNIQIPPDAPRTNVLITRTQGEFARLSPGSNVAGFVISSGDDTLIVQPARGASRESLQIIKHELAHALLRHKDFEYPFWYEEGFAEIMSATEVIDRGQAFTVGAIPDRVRGMGMPAVDWDPLVEDDFNTRELNNRRLTSSAYAQSWMLAHYTTFGDEGRNAHRLQRYFDLMRQGTGSAAAFAEAFGRSPDELWRGPLRQYVPPVFRFAFAPDTLDLDFRRLPAEEADFHSRLDYLQQLSTALGTRRAPRGALEKLAGTWTLAGMEGGCEEAVTLALDSVSQELFLDSVGSDTTAPGPLRYLVERGDSENLYLAASDLAAANYFGGAELELHMRTEELMCIRRSEAGWRIPCGRLYRRCDAS